MGKYSDVTSEERTLILRLVDEYKSNHVTSWVRGVAGRSAFLLSSDGEEAQEIEYVPSPRSFYSGLETKGFLSVVPIGQPPRLTLQLTVQKLALDYGEYASRNRLARWWEDTSYDLIHERTLWAKFVWVLLGYVLGLGSAILLRLLGWVRIGG
jgi:hypothetical protein